MEKDKKQNRVNIHNQSFQEVYRILGDKAVSTGKPNTKIAGKLILVTKTNNNATVK